MHFWPLSTTTSDKQPLDRLSAQNRGRIFQELATQYQRLDADCRSHQNENLLLLEFKKRT